MDNQVSVYKEVYRLMGEEIKAAAINLHQWFVDEGDSNRLIIWSDGTFDENFDVTYTCTDSGSTDKPERECGISLIYDGNVFLTVTVTKGAGSHNKVSFNTTGQVPKHFLNRAYALAKSFSDGIITDFIDSTDKIIITKSN